MMALSLVAWYQRQTRLWLTVFKLTPTRHLCGRQSCEGGQGSKRMTADMSLEFSILYCYVEMGAEQSVNLAFSFARFERFKRCEHGYERSDRESLWESSKSG